MAKLLPPKPNLEQLKNQAKTLLKAHKRGDVSVCETLKLLHRFSNSTEKEIFEAKISLKDVQFAIALSYGFKGWEQLAEYVESILPDRMKVLKEHLSKKLDGLEESTPEALRNRIRQDLKRIEDGTYGICEKCGGSISIRLLMKYNRRRTQCIKCSTDGKASEKDIGDLFCSFCSKNQAEIEKLIPGPDVYICDECVRLCSNILTEKKSKLDSSQRNKKEGNLHCSFCGRNQKEVTMLIAGPGAYICNNCVEQSNDTIEEELQSTAT